MRLKARVRSYRAGVAAIGAAALFDATAGCHGSSSGGAAGGGDTGHGQQVFTTTCATCHGSDGNGVKGLGKSLIGSEFVKKSSDDQLLAMVNRGRDIKDPLNTTGVAMPPKGGNTSLTDQDIRDTIAYVRTLKAS